MDFAFLIGILVLIAIMLFGVNSYLYVKNKNSNYYPVNPIYNPPTYSIPTNSTNPSTSIVPINPVNPINPIYNPPTYSIQPIPTPSTSVVPVLPTNATQYPNYGQTNNLYYTNESNQCVPCLQNNAVGWIIENNTAATLTLLMSSMFTNNNCSSGTSKVVVQVDPNSFTRWSDKIYSGTYSTLYYDSQFYFSINNNTVSVFNPSYFSIVPGDTVYIAVDNENIAVMCNGVVQVVNTPQ